MKILEWSDYIAAYAGIVATGALALEVRRWFESGVRLRMEASANMILVGEKAHRDKHYVLVSVTNVGAQPVTLVSLGLKKYPNLLARLRRKVSVHGFVPRPELDGYPPSLPCLLRAGERWQGFIRQTAEISEEIRNELFYVGIWASDKPRGRYRRVHPSTLAQAEKLDVATDGKN